MSFNCNLHSVFRVGLCSLFLSYHTNDASVLDGLESFLQRVYCFAWIMRSSLLCWLLIKFSLFPPLALKVHRQPRWQDNRFYLKLRRLRHFQHKNYTRKVAKKQMRSVFLCCWFFCCLPRKNRFTSKRFIYMAKTEVPLFES